MKILCIYHNRDLDGWMSAAIVMKWFEENHKNHIIRDYGENKDKSGNPDYLDMLGWDYGDNIPHLSEYDKVIMVDISFPKEIMADLYELLVENFIWIDHHRSALQENDIDLISGIQNDEKAACEHTWNFFFSKRRMPEIVRMLGMYDSFRHKNTDEERKVLEFQYGVRQFISDYKEAYYKLERSISHRREAIFDTIFTSPEEKTLQRGKIIYQYLCTEAQNDYKSRTFAIEIDGYKFLAINRARFNPVNFGIDYHKDGYDGFACFHYDPNKAKWVWSLYGDNGQTDVSQIAKERGGGGHFGAAGFLQDTLKFE